MSKKDSKRVALIPGSFDPMTLGHLDLITRTAGLFDEVVVAVLENSSKKPWFSAKGRVLMAQRELITLRNVRVVRFAGLLVDLAGREGADVVFVVGAENVVELRQVKLGGVLGDDRAVESGLAPGETVVIDPPAELADGKKVAEAPQ